MNLTTDDLMLCQSKLRATLQLFKSNSRFNIIKFYFLLKYLFIFSLRGRLACNLRFSNTFGLLVFYQYIYNLTLMTICSTHKKIIIIII